MATVPINGKSILAAVLPTDAKPVASAAYYGAVVSNWAAKKGSLTLPQQANISKLELASSSGTFAVKFHMDYTRVLEDALRAQVYDVASQVFRYRGTLDMVKILAPFDYVADGADEGTPPVTVTCLQDAATLAWDISPYMTAVFPDAAVGDWFHITNTDTAWDGTPLLIQSGSTSFSVDISDALVVRHPAPALALDVVVNPHPTVTTTTNSGINVSQEPGGVYSVSVSGEWTTTNIVDPIAAALADAKSYADGLSQSANGGTDVEKNRALAAEADLQAQITAEAAAARAAESLVSDNLAAEVTRATTAESGLQTSITTVSTDLAAEVLRATTAETALGDRVTSESTRASGAESILSQNLASETSRAQGVESGLRTDLSTAQTDIIANAAATTAETTRAMVRESELDGLIAAESAARAADLATNAAADAAEAEARTVGDQALGLRVDTVRDGLNSLISAAAERLSVLEAFVYQTEQFVQSSSGGSVLDFSGTLSGLTVSHPIPAAVEVAV